MGDKQNVEKSLVEKLANTDQVDLFAAAKESLQKGVKVFFQFFFFNFVQYFRIYVLLFMVVTPTYILIFVQLDHSTFLNLIGRTRKNSKLIGLATWAFLMFLFTSRKNRFV